MSCFYRVHKPNSRLRRAGGIVEVLAAGVILSVTIAAIVSMFSFGFKVTQRTDDKSVAYNISRLELERIRSEGFGNTIITRDVNGTVTSRGLDGTQTLYYSAAGAKLNTASGATYSVAITITSDRVDVLTGGAQRPAGDALRTVTVVVTRITDNSVVHRDGTFLARSGV